MKFLLPLGALPQAELTMTLFVPTHTLFRPNCDSHHSTKQFILFLSSSIDCTLLKGSDCVLIKFVLLVLGNMVDPWHMGVLSEISEFINLDF